MVYHQNMGFPEGEQPGSSTNPNRVAGGRKAAVTKQANKQAEVVERLVAMGYARIETFNGISSVTMDREGEQLFAELMSK